MARVLYLRSNRKAKALCKKGILVLTPCTATAASPHPRIFGLCQRCFSSHKRDEDLHQNAGRAGPAHCGSSGSESGGTITAMGPLAGPESQRCRHTDISVMNITTVPQRHMLKEFNYFNTMGSNCQRMLVHQCETRNSGRGCFICQRPASGG